jgi:acetyl-CoA acetyltransferase
MAKNVVAVIGTGQTKFKTHYADKTYVELAQDAAKLAMDDAGVTPDEIDAVVFSMAPTQFMGVNDCDRWATSHVWGTGKPFMRIHAGGATGGSALAGGYVHVASGVYRTVLVVGADRVAETPDAQHVLNLIWDHDRAGGTALHGPLRHDRGGIRPRRGACPQERTGQSLCPSEGRHHHRRRNELAPRGLSL